MNNQSEQVNKLAVQIEHLLSTCEKLNQENKHLRRKQSDLKWDRANLLKQRDQARANIDAILTRLKNYEVLS